MSFADLKIACFMGQKGQKGLVKQLPS